MNAQYPLLLALLFPLSTLAQTAPASSPSTASSQPASTQPMSRPSEASASSQPSISETLFPESPSQQSVSEGIAVSSHEKTSYQLPTEFAIGSAGKVSIHSLLQGWYDSNAAAERLGSAPGTFRIRRAQLRLVGDIVPQKVSFVMMTDLVRALFRLQTVDVITDVVDSDGDGIAETPVTSPIQVAQAENIVPIRDAYVIVKTKFADIWIGQHKIPTSLEGFGPAAQLLFAERAIVSKTIGLRRDIGIKAERRTKHSYLGLSVLNGSGENQLDFDSAKDVAARLEWTPRIGDNAKLLLGIVGLQSLATQHQASRQNLEADLRLEFGSFLLQSELIHFSTRTAADSNGVQEKTRGLGSYVAAAYTFRHTLQAAARWGMFDPDRSLRPTQAIDKTTELSLSLTYFFVHHPKKTSFFSEHPEHHETKLQLSLSRFVPEHTDGNVQTSPAATNELILALQSWF